jgi:hypothetical protein
MHSLSRRIQWKTGIYRGVAQITRTLKEYRIDWVEYFFAGLNKAQPQISNLTSTFLATFRTFLGFELFVAFFGPFYLAFFGLRPFSTFRNF